MQTLSDGQLDVISQLEEAELWFIVSSVKEQWEAGQKTYIDQRVPVSSGLRKNFRAENNTIGGGS